jgi:hypothetical protein
MRHLALDIGGVVSDFDLDPFINHMAKFDTALNWQQAYIACEEMQPRLDIGLTNIDSELDRLCYYYNKGQRENYHSVMKDLWINALRPVEQIHKILEELKSNNVTIALLSNIGTDHAIKARERLPIADYIQHFSCEVGARKPSKLYFQSFEKEYRFWRGAPEYNNNHSSYHIYGESNKFMVPLYIDDKQENLNAGAKYFNTERFSVKEYPNYDLAAEALRKILINYGYLSSPV